MSEGLKRRPAESDFSIPDAQNSEKKARISDTIVWEPPLVFSSHFVTTDWSFLGCFAGMQK